MLVFDCIIAIMLMVNIVYAWQLNRKIVDIRNSKIEFSSMIKKLDESILRSEYSIDELKNLTHKTITGLNSQIDKAKFLSDDLAFLTDRASLLADKLDQDISIAREIQKTLHGNDGENRMKSSYQREAPEPPKKVAIESLLARISAVKNKKDKIEA